MASAIGTWVGTVTQKYNTKVSEASSRLTTGVINKGWRARIITNRLVSGLPKAANVYGTNSATPNLSASISSLKNIGETVSDYVNQVAGIKSGPSPEERKDDRRSIIGINKEIDSRWSDKTGSPNTPHQYHTTKGTGKRYPVSIDPDEGDGSIKPLKPVVNFNINKTAWEKLTSKDGTITSGSAAKTQNKVIIENLFVSPVEKIILQNRPQEIEVDPKTNWATIRSMGRNLPMYHYTGAEDTITMNISWYCDCASKDPADVDPEQVLSKCRLLESWSKADGYTKAPPVLKIVWGDSNLFKDHYYILFSAKYTLGGFNSGARQFNREITTSSGRQVFYNYKLYPFYATQELIFKRVASYNLTSNDFITQERKSLILSTS